MTTWCHISVARRIFHTFSSCCAYLEVCEKGRWLGRGQLGLGLPFRRIVVQENRVSDMFVFNGILLIWMFLIISVECNSPKHWLAPRSSQYTMAYHCKGSSLPMRRWDTGIQGVNIDPCGEYSHCIIKPNKMYNVTVSFNRKGITRAGHVKVEAYLANRDPDRRWLPFPGLKPFDFCDHVVFGATCPVQKRKMVVYQFPIMVMSDSTLNILHNPLDLRVTMTDDSGKRIHCFQIQVCYGKKCLST